VQDDEGSASGAVLVGIGLDRRCVQHDRLRLEGLELVAGRIDEQRLREQRVPGALGDHADREPVGGVRTGERVDDVEVALPET